MQPAPILAVENPTKIIATLGPATEDLVTLRRIIDAGVDLVRLNFSHGDHETHRRTFERVRALEAETGQFIGVIADLQGPKIRTGLLEEGLPVLLTPGERLTITTEDLPGNAERISTTYQALPGDVEPGDRILMDDGLLELRVVSESGTEVHCEIVTGGELSEHKGINLPGVAVSAPALTEKDRRDLEFAVKLEVDYGDLGVEMSPESVPMLQKQIIRACARLRVPVITATQMLDSMREHPRPTRAEASDVANAILDGTDAVMLSGETAVGRYPVETVSMMRRIAQSAEEELFHGPHLSLPSQDSEPLSFADALSRAAAQVAEDLDTKAIVAFTQSGSSARLASQCRPRVPVLAATPLPPTARRCTLYWGVRPTLVDPADNTDGMLEHIEQRVRDMELAKQGEVIVVTAGTPIGQRGTTNMMKLQVIR